MSKSPSFSEQVARLQSDFEKFQQGLRDWNEYAQSDRFETDLQELRDTFCPQKIGGVEYKPVWSLAATLTWLADNIAVRQATTQLNSGIADFLATLKARAEAGEEVITDEDRLVCEMFGPSAPFKAARDLFAFVANGKSEKQ